MANPTPTALGHGSFSEGEHPRAKFLPEAIKSRGALLLTFFFLLTLFTLPTAHAQTPKFTATAPSQVQVGQQFQIVFGLNTSGDNFIAPEISGFRVLGGPNQSTNMQYVNGSMSQSLSYSYYLQAIKEGEYKIGPAKIKVDGEIIQSKPISIKVLKAAQRTATGQQKQQGNQNAAPNAETLYGKLELSKRTVDRGEQIIAIHKIYSRVSVTNLEGMELPEFDGFWKEDIDPGEQIQVKEEVVNGVRYQVLEMKKTILYPQKAGKIVIPPTPTDLVVRQESQQRRRSIFDVFGGGYQNVRAHVEIPGATITVKDLPASGKPANFSGLTGTFKLSASVDKTELKANEAINLRIKISGKGNLYQVRAPELDLPPDIEAYDPKTNDNIKVSGSGISGSRTFEYLLIPRYAGEFELGPFQFSYFNPSKNKYVTKTSDSFQISVAKGDVDYSGPNVPLNITSKEDLRVIGSDIRYIKQGQYPILSSGDYFYRSINFYLLLMVPFLLLAGFFAYRGYIASTVGNEAHTKSKRANSLSRKRLKTAEKLMKENNEAAFYEEIQKALSGFVADRFNIPQSEMSKEKITSLFTEKDVPQEVGGNYLKVMSDAEFKRYAPSAGGSMQEMYEQALNVVTKIQDHV